MPDAYFFLFPQSPTCPAIAAILLPTQQRLRMPIERSRANGLAHKVAALRPPGKRNKARNLDRLRLGHFPNPRRDRETKLVRGARIATRQ